MAAEWNEKREKGNAVDPKSQYDQTRRYAFSFGLSMFLLTFACSFFSQALEAPLETLAAVGIGFAAATMLVIFWQGWSNYVYWFTVQVENQTLVIDAEPVRAEPEIRMIPLNYNGPAYPVNPQIVDDGESASPLKREDVAWWLEQIRTKGHARNTWLKKTMPSGRKIGRGVYEALIQLAGLEERHQGATGHL